MGSTFSANSLSSSSYSSLEVELDVEEPEVMLRDYLDQEAVESNIIEDNGDTEGSWEESSDNIGRSFFDDEAHEVNEPSTSRGTHKRCPPTTCFMTWTSDSESEADVVCPPKRKRTYIQISSDSSDSDPARGRRNKQRVQYSSDNRSPIPKKRQPPNRRLNGKDHESKIASNRSS